jgi:hypothetical protein
MQSLCNPLIEDYTEIFYMTDKGDMTWFRGRVSLRLAVNIDFLCNLGTDRIDTTGVTALPLLRAHVA